MRYKLFFPSSLFPLPLLGGVRGGFLLPLASCFLPIASSLALFNNGRILKIL
ncbi:MAG: hypothetical protein F6K65_10445 [Moorea sp. SIO3C2]|nr:hypothetical protein [Moorena sp. SIO3C2]